MVIKEYGADGIVKEIVSDNGSQFTSVDFTALLKHYDGLKHHRIPVGSPKHGGFYEIRHRDAKRVISKELISRPHADWAELAVLAEFKVNSNRHGSYPSPFALMHRREPSSFSSRVYETVVKGSIKWSPTPCPGRRSTRQKCLYPLRIWTGIGRPG